MNRHTTPAMLARRWRELLDAASAARKAASTVEKTVKTLSAPDGYIDLRKAARLLAKLEGASLEPGRLERLEAELRPLADDTRAWVTAEAARRRHHIVDALLDEFRERGLTLERLDGPGIRLRRRPVTIELDLAKEEVHLLHAGQPLPGARPPLAAPAIFLAWEKARQKLYKDETSPDKLAQELEGAYRDLVHLEADGRKRAAGGGFRLRDLHYQVFVRRQSPQVRSNPARPKAYPRYQFAWDLASLLDYIDEHGTPLDGRALVFRPAPASAIGQLAESVQVERADGRVEHYASLAIRDVA